MNLLLPLARRFIAGETAEEAIRVVAALNARGMKATLDILGENVRSRDAARRAANAYNALLDSIAATGVDSNISLKLTQLGLDLGDDFCAENLSRILHRAAERGNFVRIDMEGSAYTQRTLDLFFKLHDRYGNVGVVIQAYLYRSQADIRALNERRARVRLCKGAYKEPPTIAFRRKEETNRNFLALMRLLLAEGTYPAIATHDSAMIERTLDFARERGIPPDQFEFQMLYGIRRRLQEDLARGGYIVRIYVPFGTHWLPYIIRRLRERRENLLFVLRHLFRD